MSGGVERIAEAGKPDRAARPDTGAPAAAVPQFAAVVGGGAWGGALAGVLAGAGVGRVRVFSRDREARAALATARTLPALPGVVLPEVVAPLDTLPEAAEAPLIVMAVPAQATRAVLADVAAGGLERVMLVLTAKGVEAKTGALQTEIAREVAPGCRTVVLSGPSFAVDVARGLPTAVTLAAADIADAERAAAAFASDTFRPYASDDPIGVELGGALKNVYAIASGIVTGTGLGESARAALIARAIAELARLAVALGARPATISGLSGIGDLVLTATSDKSRNFAFGRALAEGAAPDTAWRGTDEPGPHGKLVEGAATAEAAVALAARHGVDVPIAAAVADVLTGASGISEAVARLMRRPLRREEETARR